jgi:YesN/AraC family two-component response regulator
MVITLEDVQHDQSPRYYKLMSMTDSIMDSMKLLEAEKLQVQIQRWFEALAQYNISPEMIRQLNMQCLMKAAMILNEAGVDPDKICLPEDVRESLNQYDSLEGLQHYLVQVLSGYMEHIRFKRSNREKSDLILRVLDYIQANYSRADLSLNLLAEEFSVSVSHLSKMFKEQAESNFIDYLMGLRLAKAKQLLEETDGKVRDIAEAVGYSNVNSFVRIFKKLTALTPSEYRERKVRKDETK